MDRLRRLQPKDVLACDEEIANAQATTSRCVFLARPRQHTLVKPKTRLITPMGCSPWHGPESSNDSSRAPYGSANDHAPLCDG